MDSHKKEKGNTHRGSQRDNRILEDEDPDPNIWNKAPTSRRERKREGSQYRRKERTRVGENRCVLVGQG